MTNLKTIDTVKISKNWKWIPPVGLIRLFYWAILDIFIARNNCLETQLLLSLYRYVCIIENFIVSVIIYITQSAVNGARSCLNREIYGLFYFLE